MNYYVAFKYNSNYSSTDYDIYIDKSELMKTVQLSYMYYSKD